MDTLIKDGDLFVDENGSLVSITDEPEKLQRILFILSTEKGAFSFDRELGSALYTLGAYSADKLDTAAFEIVSDALIGIEGVSVKSAKVSKNGNEYSVEVSVYIESLKRLVKIKI